MNFLVLRILSLMTGLLLAGNAICDQVFLKNGDVISGVIISKMAGNLILQTSYAGEITIRWEDVKHLTTNKPVRLTLDDETVLQGLLSLTDDKELLIGHDAQTKVLTLSRITAINPPETVRFKFSGQLNLGIEADRGNTDEDKYYLDAETEFRWPRDRLTFAFEGRLEKNNSKKTEQKGNFIGDYDHFLTEKWYLTTGFLLEHDKFANLDLRTTLRVGSGYQILENNSTNLTIEAGPGYVWENFDGSQDQDYSVAFWSLRLDHYLFKEWKLQTFHNHRLTLSLEDTADYIFKSRTGLRVPILDQLQATLQYNFDRDNSPADDAKKNDHEYLLTAGYKW